MRKTLIFLLFALSFQIICKSQVISYDRLIESKERSLIGNSKQFRSLDLIISFQKAIQSKDTAYYIKFQLLTSEIETRSNIFISKNNSITFTSKTGKSVVLTVHKDIRVEESYTEELYETPKFFYKTTFYLKITKEQLLVLGSEKFYTLTLAYNDVQTKTESIATFYSPKFFTRRSFIQKDIKKLLGAKIKTYTYSE